MMFWHPQRFDERVQEEHIVGYLAQLDFIERQFSKLGNEKSKFEAAYQRDIFTLDEFEEKMKDLQGRV